MASFKVTGEHLDAQMTLCDMPPNLTVKYIQFHKCRKKSEK